MIIPIGSDHRGFELKSRFIPWLKTRGFDAKDLGTHSAERCDALDFATGMAAEFTSDPPRFGVLICGSGQAMAMTANRYRSLRAALCANVETARLAREHNDANVLVIGADLTPRDMALQILEVFIRTPFLGGRYAERRDKLTGLGGL
ncbi:MAG TPA: RpiB/LacA/LacB family sugar-phosphate isomerase [Caulobacteraceae bacterium]|jgi:ribose 5-phosphate isomerase B|nr:RpiB/LacA/LacB family sugar-phosphate isomerase [Caulobacteraceae bacterium]